MAPPRRTPLAEPIFVNREGPLARFAEAVADIPADGLRLLVFHGVGGQGKTALLRHIQRLAGPAGKSEYRHLRTAMLDLHGRSTSDPDLLLVWIRNGLAVAGVSFPAFDLALAIYWESARPEQPLPNLVNAWLARSTEAGLTILPEAVQSLREAAEQTVETIPGLGFLLSKGGKWVIDRHKRRYLKLKRPDLQALYATPGRPKEPWQLAELLPWMLAQDLNHHLGEHPGDRFLLLVDEYEGLFQGGDLGMHWRGNPFDKQMRAFMSETDGLLAVFGSRRMLPWKEDADWRSDLAAAGCPLEGLKDSDARDWLAKVPVADHEIAAAMLEGAREEKRPDALVYPLLLNLQVAHWQSLTSRGVAFGPNTFRVEAESFKGRCEELVEQLLRSYDRNLRATLERLSVTNRFDRAAFVHVVQSFGTGLPLDFFDELPNLSFIEKGEDSWLTMHRAVAEAIAETLKPKDRWRESVKALLAHFEARAAVEQPLDVSETTLEALFEAAFLRRKLGAEGYVVWLDQCYEVFLAAGKYRQCEILWRDAFNFGRQCSEFQNFDIATCLSNLGYTLRLQERLDEAEKYFYEGLNIRLKIFGKNHHKVASSYNNIATILNARGLYEDAALYYKKSINILERSPNNSKEFLSIRYGSLGFLLNDCGKLGSAMKFTRKGLRIRQQIFRPDHRKIASSYNAIAMILNARRYYKIAEVFLNLCLNIRLTSLGIENPDTAQTYNNIAFNLKKQGRILDAELIYRESLEIRVRALGENHPLIAQSYNNIAAALNAQGRLKEAEILYRKALDIKTEAYGESHPTTAISFNNLARNLSLQFRNAEAKQAQYKTLIIIERIYGIEDKRAILYRKKLYLLDDNLKKRQIKMRILPIRRIQLHGAKGDEAMTAREEPPASAFGYVPETGH